jgi:transketolase
MLTNEQYDYLEQKSKILRKHVLNMTYRAQSGHPGGSFSLAHIMSALYFYDLNYDIENPDWMERDRVILSKGHAAPIWYAALAEAGFFPKKELDEFRQINGLLQGHPCMHIPGVDITTGSLGLGLSAACGVAIGAKITKRDQVRVFAILGDGELGEGQIWEAGLAASHFELNNLIAIIDRNRYQNDGATKDILRQEPLSDKWTSFGWTVLEVDGHNLHEITDAFSQARKSKKKPTMIIANTVKGNGASYMLDKPHLHYTPPTKEQLDMTMKELGF